MLLLLLLLTMTILLRHRVKPLRLVKRVLLTTLWRRV